MHTQKIRKERPTKKYLHITGRNSGASIPNQHVQSSAGYLVLQSNCHSFALEIKETLLATIYQKKISIMVQMIMN